MKTVFFSSDIILDKNPKIFIYQNYFMKVISANEVISLVHVFHLLFFPTINFVVFIHDELS